MDELREYLLMLRRRWQIVLWCVTLCMTTAFLVAYLSPTIYRSTGTIIIERADIPEDLARSTVAGVVEQRLELVRRRVMTDDALQPLVDEYDLYPEYEPGYRASMLARNVSLEQVNPVTLEPEIGGSAFSLHFDYPVATASKQVTDDLIELFLADNRRARTETAAETERFFAAQGEKLAGEVAALEERIAIFKRENQGLLPEDIRRNQSMLERHARELDDVQAAIRRGVERRDLLAGQLDEISGGTQLAILRTELAVARQKYTDDHPDIKRLLRTIAALESAGPNSYSRLEAELAAARERYGNNHPEVLRLTRALAAAEVGGQAAANATDPNHRRVSTQLEATQRELAAFRQTERQLRAEIADLEDRLVLAPEVEKALQELNRDYQLATSAYREMRQKRSEAEVAQNLEAEDKSERFTLLRQPRLADTPYSPNRVGIFLVGIIFALGSSAGITALREAADPTVRSARDVFDALQGPPIATIPIIMNETDRRENLRHAVFHGTAFATVIIAAIGIISIG